MIRFTMPEAVLAQEKRKALLKEQFDAFLQADALRELLSVIGTDPVSLPGTAIPAVSGAWLHRYQRSVPGRSYPNAALRRLFGRLF